MARVGWASEHGAGLASLIHGAVTRHGVGKDVEGTELPGCLPQVPSVPPVLEHLNACGPRRRRKTRSCAVRVPTMTPSTSAPALLPAHSWLQAPPVAWWRQYWQERCLCFGEGTGLLARKSWEGAGQERGSSESWARPEERDSGDSPQWKGLQPQLARGLTTGKCTQGMGPTGLWGGGLSSWWSSRGTRDREGEGKREGGWSNLASCPSPGFEWHWL